MGAFDYIESPHARRHGPQGYARHTSYRPWLRDEFSFRCVYCLARENWGKVTGEYDVEHFQPQATNPNSSLEYDNLLYACRTCNELKGDRHIPNPCDTLTADQIRVNLDGTIEGRTKVAKKIIRLLGLDSDSYNSWRLVWIRNIELATEYDEEQFLRLMGFPEHLPNLSTLRPPRGNRRPEGVQQSYFAQRERSELPEIY